jgi:uncharacterized protein (TIGR03083 family)
VAPSALDAFEHEATRLASVLTSTAADGAGAPAGLDQPSTCPPWTVRELACHVRIAIARVPRMLTEPPPPGPPIPARAYYTAERFTGADRVAAARLDAASWPSERALAGAFADAVRATVAAARRHDPTRSVRTRWGDAMTLADYLTTRVVEVTVHGLDIAASLRRPPWTSPDAADHVAALLTGNGAGLAAFGWPPVTLIAKATGRAPLTDAEAAAVAGTGITWPVLS